MRLPAKAVQLLDERLGRPAEDGRPFHALFLLRHRPAHNPPQQLFQPAALLPAETFIDRHFPAEGEQQHLDAGERGELHTGGGDAQRQLEEQVVGLPLPRQTGGLHEQHDDHTGGSGIQLLLLVRERFSPRQAGVWQRDQVRHSF